MGGITPALPIITMSEAQAFLRIETGEEEALLAGLIRTASGLCEAFINQLVIARDFEIDVPASGSWERRSTSTRWPSCRGQGSAILPACR